MKNPRMGKRLGWFLLATACLAWMLIATRPRAVLAAPPEDPFDFAHQDKNAVVSKIDNGKTKPNRPVLDLRSQELLKRITLAASISQPTIQPGKTVRLTIQGKPKPGFYTYPINKRTAAQSKGQVARIDIEKTFELEPLQPIEETAPVLGNDTEGNSVFKHKDEFTWSQEILVLPTAKQGVKKVPIKVWLQVCDEGSCVGPAFYPPLEISFEVKGDSVALTNELEARRKLKAVDVEVVDDQGLWGFIVLSMSAAGLMLLTPCVFPMIPITVSFFLKQSEKEHHNALLSAGVYSVTIVVVLTMAVFLLGSVVITLANDPWLNLGLGAVLIFFALSLFGMYEIELPSFLARFTSAREGQGGIMGAFFMALTFTITSFTCTGPFLGPILAGAATANLTTDKLILGALAYSIVFAAPFFVLALFPKLLKTLPKSGGWLNAIKVVMGFLELAAALKFIANTDLALNPGDPALFGYETVLCAWIALSVACGLYLFGLFRLPHDSPIEHVGVVRMLFATIFCGLAVYMTPALWRVTPQGVIGKGLVAFLPLDTNPDLDWTRNLEEAWAEAAKDEKSPRLIFVDFTGVNCTNCRFNEKNIFTKPAVRELMKEYVRLQLYTDSVPEEGLSVAQSKEQAERNSKIQADTFGDVTNPFYAIIKPDKGKKPFTIDADGKYLLNGTIIGIRKGLIPNNKIRDFERFLKEPLK